MLFLYRFDAVRDKFVSELQEIRRNEDNNKQLLHLIIGMKFIRVKMYPVEEFESCFR